MSIPTVGLTKFHIWWILWVKQPRSEADHPYLHLQLRLRMDKTTPPLLHKLSWCTQGQLYLHITLTSRLLDYTSVGTQSSSSYINMYVVKWKNMLLSNRHF